MMKRKLGRGLIAHLREGPGPPSRGPRALAEILGRDLVDAPGPATLERIAHAELQAADAVDLDGRGLAVLQRSDALVIGAQEEQIARLQGDHGAHPRQTLLDG